MRAKIDINEVETRTKIRAKYLRAIENEEWALLPGDVYVKSFLRTYADYLGLDSRQLIDDYKRRYERPSDHEMRQIAPLGRERDRRERGARPPRAPRPPRGRVGLSSRRGRSSGSCWSGSWPRCTSSATTRVDRRPRAPRPRTPRRRSPRPSTTAAPAGPARWWPARSSSSSSPPARCTSASSTGSGKRLIPGEIFNVGQTIPTKTSSKLLLTLGNASVKMKVNGVSVPVPSTGSPVGFDLTPGSHAMLPAAKQPQCA